MSDCAFDEVAFDAVAFDVCVQAPPAETGGGGGTAPRRKRLNLPIMPLDDDEAVLIWYASEEL